MKVHIHRGKDQIGGNIIEISTEKTKILLDVGLELDGKQELPEIPGLFERAEFDAIFISHYHEDHVGLAYYANKGIPVYMGEATYKILKAADDYNGRKTVAVTAFLQNEKSIVVGDITVTPYLCDHSAFDSYMLYCEAGGESVLYTGDFRSNGRKSFDSLSSKLPRNPDKLICEGTTLSRGDNVAVTERKLEESAVELFKNTKGPIFVLQSAMNIDRIVTMYRAAKRSGRIFLEDVYAADIASAAGESIPNPKFSDVYAFITSGKRFGKLVKYKRRAGKEFISKKSFVMCVRSTMTGYLKSLANKMSFENGVIVYSMWDGYREKEGMKEFLSACENLGLKIVAIHTSGHADTHTIKRLIEAVNPKTIIPVHTECAKKFKEIAPDAEII